MPRTLIRCKSLAHVFAWSDESEKEMQVQLARMSVLFEDLMVEHAGARTDTIPPLDGSGGMARKFYFVRRAINTEAEIAQAIHVLNMNRAFKRHKKAMPAWQCGRWDEAVRFFSDNGEFLKAWRDDMGGHFLDRTARHALESLDDSVGSMEIFEVPGNHGMHNVRLKFAYELLAAGMSRRKSKQEDFRAFAERSFVFVHEAWGHAAQAMHTLVQTRLWHRFG